MTENLRDQLQSTFGSTYTIQRELGGGGMSRIFVARDETLGRDIVVKVLPRELAAEMSAERFTREIKLAAALQHPHVLPVLSAGVSEGLPYYTMPFVRGESLRAAMSRGKLSTDDSIGILRDVARALRYAHGEGIIHRDIKPENILLSGDSAVVTDFGIAKALSASKTETPGGTLTIVGSSMGTPAYMSPEQAAADPNIDHRSDIYSWGVMAYELLSGHHPFEGKKTPQQYLGAHLAEIPVPLRKIAPSVPIAAADVVMRSLEKDPDRRQQSADELLDQLGGLSSGTDHTALARLATSRWRIPAIVGAAVAVLAIGFAVSKNRGSLNAAQPIMLAVLPFENQGPAEQDYFVDGLTDAVNGKLAGLSGVSVIDRRSSALYRKTTKPVKQIGTELGVQFVVGGVVRWAKTDSAWRAQVMPTLVKTSNESRGGAASRTRVGRGARACGASHRQYRSVRCVSQGEGNLRCYAQDIALGPGYRPGDFRVQARGNSRSKVRARLGAADVCELPACRGRAGRQCVVACRDGIGEARDVARSRRSARHRHQISDRLSSGTQGSGHQDCHRRIACRADEPRAVCCSRIRHDESR